MQSMREAEQIIRQWEDAYSSPPEEEYEACHECGREAEYSINGILYCENCAVDNFLDDRGICDYCGEVVETTYRVRGETYCERCFKDNFRRY